MTTLVKITAMGLTDVGRVRTTNQDAYLVDLERGLFIVADGMGGHAGGEIASQLAIKEIAAYVHQNVAFLDDQDLKHPDQRLASVLAQAVNHASTRIYERALEEPSLKGMGTTATLLKIAGDHAYCAHVGDSRLYLFRCGLLYQLTNDHSLVSEQVRAGLLTKEEAELHHLRNVITRSVGYQEEEDVDTTFLALEDGDMFVICTDGLHGKVSDKEIAQHLATSSLEAAQALLDLANSRGGEDNITLVVLRAQVSEELSR